MNLDTIFEYKDSKQYDIGEIIKVEEISFEVMASMPHGSEYLYHLSPKFERDKVTDNLVKEGYLDDVVSTYISAFEKFPILNDNRLSEKRNEYIETNLEQLNRIYGLDKR